MNGDGIDELILGYSRDGRTAADDFHVEVFTFDGSKVSSYKCNAYWGENSGGDRIVRLFKIDGEWLLADGYGHDMGYEGKFIGVRNGAFSEVHSAILASDKICQNFIADASIYKF